MSTTPVSARLASEARRRPAPLRLPLPSTSPSHQEDGAAVKSQFYSRPPPRSLPAGEPSVESFPGHTEPPCNARHTPSKLPTGWRGSRRCCNPPRLSKSMMHQGAGSPTGAMKARPSGPLVPPVYPFPRRPEAYPPAHGGAVLVTHEWESPVVQVRLPCSLPGAGPFGVC